MVLQVLLALVLANPADSSPVITANPSCSLQLPISSLVP